MQVDPSDRTSTPTAATRTGQQTPYPPDEDDDLDATPIQTLLANSKEYQKSIQASRSGPRDPLDKYLKGPLPKVHLAHPAGAFDFVNPKKITEWNSYPVNKLLALPFGFDARQQFRHDNIRARLLAAIVEITKAEQVGIAAPGPEDRMITFREETPMTFLVHSLTKQQKATLLQRGTWISAEMSFRVVTLQPASQDYLFTLNGLATVGVQAVGEMILAKWDEEKVQEALMAAIQTDTPNHPQVDIPAFLDSIRVQRLDLTILKVTVPKFNIYTNSELIQNHETWTRVRDVLIDQSYNTPMLGRCKIEIGAHHCNICHGADHPVGYCTFPLVEGWNGPAGNNEFLEFEKSLRNRGGPSRFNHRR
jgi:hypothetical protein